MFRRFGGPGMHGVGGVPLAGMGAGCPSSYASKVLGYGPIAYWPLWETSGTVAACLPNSAMNGTYNTDVSGWPPGTGIGDENTAPYFDGTNDFVNIYSAAFNTPFNENEHTAMIWMRIPAASWTDGLDKYVICLSWGGFTEYTVILKSFTNNTLQLSHRAGGVSYTKQYITAGNLSWFHAAITVSATANQTRFYYNGAELLPEAACGAAAASGFDVTRTCIGARITTPTNPFLGYAAHAAVFGSALAPSVIADLAVV